MATSCLSGGERPPNKAAPCSTCSPLGLTVDRHEEHLARLSGGVGGDALEPPLVPGAGAGDEQRARGLHPAWAQHTLGTAPAPWGATRGGKKINKKKTTQGARRVPVSTGQEVWVQGVAVLLPPDLGCRGA